MTGEAIRIEEFAFNPHTPDVAKTEEKCSDWPVVYLIHGSLSKKPCPLYIGETSNFIGRVKQHLADEEKCNLYSGIKVVINNRYNKSAILDVEQTLIRLFKCDPQFAVKTKISDKVHAMIIFRGFLMLKKWRRFGLAST